MHSTPPLLVMDYVGPAGGAVLFVLVMSVVKEPTRRTLNAIVVAGASGVYLSGGFGPWELVYPAIVTPVVYRGLRSYRFIGLAWFMHSCWDVVHHLWGNPIWPFMPTSAFGCMIFDALIAGWFLAGAPSVFALGSPGKPETREHRRRLEAQFPESRRATATIHPNQAAKRQSCR